MDLEDRWILVTGAAGVGVASGICDMINKYNGNLILVDIDKDNLKEVAKKYENSIAIAGDIRNQDIIDKAFNEADKKKIVITGLVNNAGIGLSQFAHKVTDDEFDRLFEIDVKALWSMTRSFLRHVLGYQKRGSIVNISSVHAHATLKRYSLYAGAKSNIEGFSRGIAVEYGRNEIRCNVVAPGYIHAEQNIPLIRTWVKDPYKWVDDLTQNQQSIQKKIHTNDCGEAVVFFLSDSSKSITGETLKVDGGSTILLYNNDFL